MNGATLAEARHNMSAPIESDDPDFLVHSAWLAEASKGADGPLVKQVLNNVTAGQTIRRVHCIRLINWSDKGPRSRSAASGDLASLW